MRVSIESAGERERDKGCSCAPTPKKNVGVRGADLSARRRPADERSGERNPTHLLQRDRLVHRALPRRTASLPRVLPKIPWQSRFEKRLDGEVSCRARDASAYLKHRSARIKHSYSVHEVEAALEAIGPSLGDVSVSFSDANATAACPSSEDKVNVLSVEFESVFGSLPPLVIEDFTASFSGTVLAKSVGQDADRAYFTTHRGVAVLASEGDKEFAPCAGRGDCPARTGACECYSSNFELYGSSDLYGGPGLQGDCRCISAPDFFSQQREREREEGFPVRHALPARVRRLPFDGHHDVSRRDRVQRQRHLQGRRRLRRRRHAVKTNTPLGVSLSLSHTRLCSLGRAVRAYHWPF